MFARVNIICCRQRYALSIFCTSFSLCEAVSPNRGAALRTTDSFLLLLQMFYITYGFASQWTKSYFEHPSMLYTSERRVPVFFECPSICFERRHKTWLQRYATLVQPLVDEFVVHYRFLLGYCNILYIGAIIL